MGLLLIGKCMGMEVYSNNVMQIWDKMQDWKGDSVKKVKRKSDGAGIELGGGVVGV